MRENHQNAREHIKKAEEDERATHPKKAADGPGKPKAT